MADLERGLDDQEEKHRQETLAEQARELHREKVGPTDLQRRAYDEENRILEERQNNRPEDAA